MASSDKLWFELGVRDEVGKAIKEDIRQAEWLTKALKESTVSFEALLKMYSQKGALEKEDKKSVDAIIRGYERYFKVLAKIKREREALKSMKQKAIEMGVDTKDIDAAIRKLNAWNAAYHKLAEGKGTNSAAFKVKAGKVFDERMKEIEDVIRAYGKLINVERTEAVAATRAVQQANQGLSASYEKVTKSSQQTMNTLSMLRQQAGYYFSLFGAKTLIQSVITTGGQFEYQQVALKNIIGDAEKAVVLFSQLKDLAIESPKTFMELTTTAKQLSAYQTPVNELYDTTKRLSDLSVGLGVDVNRLVLAFGQVRAAAVLRGQELRQFTEAGIPIVQALADKFTQMNGKLTTTADVFKLISARAVPFEMVKEVLWEMTSEGGRFFNMQAEMADTLYGKWQKLADIWQITLGDMANTNIFGLKPFTAFMDMLIFAARSLSSLMPVLSGVLASRLFKLFSTSSKNAFSTKVIDENIAKSQRLYSIELRRKMVLGEINEKEFKSLSAFNRRTDKYYMLLAAERQISDYQIHRLIKEGKITEQKVRQAELDGIILKEEAEQLRVLLRMNAQGKLGTMGGMARSTGNSILGFMGGWTGVAFAGIGVAMSLWQNIQQKNEEAEARLKERISNAQELWKKARDVEKSLTSGAVTEEEITRMSDWLKENSASWDMVSEAMKNNDGTAKDLEERYKLLKQAIEDTKNAAEKMSTGDNLFSIADKRTNRNDLFKDSLSENLRDAQKNFETLGKVIDSIIGNSLIPLTKAMDDLKNTSPELVKVFEEQGADTLAEQLKIVATMSDEYEKLYQISKTYGISTEIGSLSVAMRKYNNEMEKAERQLPIFAEEVENKLRGMYAKTGIDFKNLTSEQRELILKLYKDWLDENKITSDAVLRELDNKFLNKRYNIRLVLTTDTGNVDMSTFAKHVWESHGGLIAGDKGKVRIGGKEYTKQQVAQTFPDDSFVDTANSNLDKLDKTIERYDKMGAKAAAAEKKAERSGLQAMLDDLAPGLRTKKGGKGGGGGGGGTGKDTQLEAVRNRVDLYKKFFSELESARRQYGQKGALDYLKKNGFEAVFDWKLSDVTNYSKSIDELTAGLENTTEARKKFLNDTNAAKVGLLYRWQGFQHCQSPSVSRIVGNRQGQSRPWHAVRHQGCRAPSDSWWRSPVVVPAS